MGVVWGLPVNPAQLGAHLEAYVDMKPTIDALRLCNRFGRGPEAHVTKIPQELVSMIELELVRKLRFYLYHCHWEDKFRCLEHRCDEHDHFTEERLVEIKEQAVNELEEEGVLGLDMDYDEYMDRHQDLKVERVIEIMAEDESAQEEHFMKTRHWMCRFDLHGGHFNALEPVLASDFGLHAVISHRRISNNQMDACGRSITFGQAAETTVCYLVLPATVVTEENCCGADRQQAKIFGDSMMSVLLDSTTLTITEKQKARFGRAMQILGLKPHVHFTQLANTAAAVSVTGSKRHLLTRNSSKSGQSKEHPRGPSSEEIDVAIEEAEERAKKLELSEWPKLVIFASNHTPMKNLMDY